MNATLSDLGHVCDKGSLRVQVKETACQTFATQSLCSSEDGLEKDAPRGKELLKKTPS